MVGRKIVVVHDEEVPLAEGHRAIVSHRVQAIRPDRRAQQAMTIRIGQ